MTKFRLPRLDWIELLLVGAAVSLVFQLFPAAWWSLIGSLDPRGWSRATWFVLNLLVLLTLFGIKLGPGLYEDVQRDRAEKASKRPRKSTSTVLEAKTLVDDDYQARLRRDAEWRERAKKRHPWR